MQEPLCLVDSENMPGADLGTITIDARVIVFTGVNQKSVPLDPVSVTPRLGHRDGSEARFTRSHPPERSLGAQRCASRGEGLSMEYRVERWRPIQKRALAATWAPTALPGDVARPCG
jgi:hypothetical protein